MVWNRNKKRMKILEHLEDALQRRREVELRIEAELGEVEDSMAETLRIILEAVDEVEGAARDRQDEEMEMVG